jgi:nucleoside-diphosphate-sugar epimerase
MDLSIYGATGIIGSYYQSLFPGTVIPREQLDPETKEVLYLISTTDNSSYKENPLLDIDTNLVVLMRRLHACKETGIDTFNFISSWYVYGPHNENPSEQDDCKPNGFYSITKYTAERLIQEYCKEYKINYRILRLGNVYGGPDSGNKKRNALHYLVNQLKEGKKICVHKEITRDFIHIFDVCIAIKLICETGDINKIYNVGNGIEVPLLDALFYCKHILSSRGEIVQKSVDSNYDQAIRCSLNCTELQSLGFSPTINIYEGLADLCLHQKFCTPDPTLMDKKLKLRLLA